MQVKIMSFKIDTYKQYKYIENRDIRRFKGALPSYKMAAYETIYLIMYKPRFLKEYMIGRCIIANTAEIKDNDKIDIISSIQDIPKAILYKYPLIIEDLFILQKNRNQGYGRFIVNYILNDVKDGKFSLKAQGDGLWFWSKYGFRLVGNDVFIK